MTSVVAAMRLGFLATAMVSLLGCGAVPQAPKEIEIGADIVVSDSLNPDANGRPSPMMLAIYQLKNADKFRNEDFFSVFDPQGLALGADLLRREQVTLQPGGSRSYEAEFDAETVFIGLVGAFSDLENAQWRAVIEIPETGLLKRMNIFSKERLKITIGDRSVAIAIGGRS